MATEIDIESMSDKGIALRLHDGPTLENDFSYKLLFPHTPHTKRRPPESFEELLESTTMERMGGNIANMLRTKIQMAVAGIGAEKYRVFSPPDKYLDAWLEEQLPKVKDSSVDLIKLDDMVSRIGVALPYNGEKGPQPFSFNRPQPDTIEPMRAHVSALRGLDQVLVSEGLGAILTPKQVQVKQLFNPTSALHNESALELVRRRKGTIADRTMVNTKEMNDWIGVMENRLEIATGEPVEAHFPSIFSKSKHGISIDEEAVKDARTSHTRIMHIMRVPETEHVDFVTGVGCGPDGGQNQFQVDGKHYVACSSALSKKGAQNLIELCGRGSELNISIEDAVGAGDAAYTASSIAMLYAPQMEDVIEQKYPNMSKERKRIAIMAFTTILQRVFGELAFRSHNRDLSCIPPAAFPRIFDATLEKSIAASQHIVQTSRNPEKIYSDNEWGMYFAVMELDS